MTFFAIASGIITCLQGALSIVQSFKTECYEQPVASGHGRGFWDFYAFSTTSRKGIGFDKMDQYLRQNVLGRIQKINAPSQKYIDTVTAEILEIADYESYIWDEAEFSVNSVQFSNNAGKLYFLIYTFTPKVKASTGQEYFYVQQMRMEVENFKLAQDWVLINKVKASMLKTSSSLEWDYRPTAMDSQKLVDAVALAFAPVALGLVTVPDNFLKLLAEAVKAQLESSSDLPQFSTEQIASTMELYNQMVARQKERDQLAQDGLSTIGKGISSFKGDSEVSTDASE